MTRIHKTAHWVEKDEEQQVATGVLLVPDRIDSQGDWFSGETIRRVARDYMVRLQAGEAEQKIMHAVGAGEKIALVENRVLESAETIGDTEHGPGTWLVSVKVQDPRLWKLFQNGTISGFSIGGNEIEGVEQSPSDVPDSVTRADQYPDGATATRIDSVTITEFSPVDKPAVGPAKVEVLKSLVSRRSQDAAESDPLREGGQSCIDALEERGHAAGDAELLCEVMHSDSDEDPDSDSDSDPESDTDTEALKTDTDMTQTDSTSVTKKEYSNGEWTTWPRLTGNSRGQVVDSETDPEMGFSDAISGDVSVSAEEDNPVYLLEVWDGFGEDAGAREESAGRGDTFHVANRESRLTATSDPRERESASDEDEGMDLLDRMLAALPFMEPGEEYDESAESDSDVDTEAGASASASPDPDPDTDTNPGGSSTDTDEHGDTQRQIESMADEHTEQTDEHSDATTDTDTDTAAKLDAVLESVEDLQDSVEENSDRISRVATDTAGTEQATGTDDSNSGDTEDERSETAKFLYGLAGGK